MELKTLEHGEIDAALALADEYKSRSQSEIAESICQDILEIEPDHIGALDLLYWTRIDALKKGLPGAVERVQELLLRFAKDSDRAYRTGVFREEQARHLLGQRGQHSNFIAYDWFRHAMDEFEEAVMREPRLLEARLHWNACVRTLRANPQCKPTPDEMEEHGIE